MPRTVDEGFRDFLARLTPSATESEAAKAHRASIEARLKSDLGLLRFFRIGSFGNGTSISAYSDVDYLASLPLPKDSNYSLQKVKKSLEERFPNTGVKVSCPAVVCPFGTSPAETTEIVPGTYVTNNNGVGVYDIADCAGGWMKASPAAHNEYVRSIDTRLGGKVKPLIRFIKAWKYYRAVPISSFYLELRVAKYANNEPNIIYDIDVKKALCQLRDCGLASMQDPIGVSGYIPACKTEAMKDEAISKLTTAATRAEKAREAASRGDVSGAFDWWGLVYDNHFPTYDR
jgi:hypothetical protein